MRDIATAYGRLFTVFGLCLAAWAGLGMIGLGIYYLVR
jgi:hypothetical protein